MEKNLNKKYLMVKGARQVGKTFFVDKFCRENYKSDIYINFFENGLDVEIIIKQITIRILNVHFVTHHDFSQVLQNFVIVWLVIMVKLKNIREV